MELNSKQKVIQRKNEEDSGDFEIGHSQTESKTFIPHFKIDKEKSMVFADIAGLNDTGGIFIDTINCFINRVIFKHCQRLKIIMAFPINAILEGRGTGIRTLIRTVQKIFLADPQKIVDSVIPIITKCPVSRETSIDDLRDTVYELLSTTMQASAPGNDSSLKDSKED